MWLPGRSLTSAVPSRLVRIRRGSLVGGLFADQQCVTRQRRGLARRIDQRGSDVKHDERLAGGRRLGDKDQHRELNHAAHVPDPTLKVRETEPAAD